MHLLHHCNFLPYLIPLDDNQSLDDNEMCKKGEPEKRPYTLSVFRDKTDELELGRGRSLDHVVTKASEPMDAKNDMRCGDDREVLQGSEGQRSTVRDSDGREIIPADSITPEPRSCENKLRGTVQAEVWR